MSTSDIAPFIPHPQFERALIECSLPEWEPTPATAEMLKLPGEGVALFLEWLAGTYNRGFCKCGRPIKWTGARRRETCGDTCRKRRSRSSLAHLEWARAQRINDNLRSLNLLEYEDWERKQRREKYRKLLDGTHKPPPRLGHAKPRREIFRSEGSSVYRSIETYAEREWRVIASEPSDRAADDYLRASGFNKDGSPRKKSRSKKIVEGADGTPEGESN